jgi:PIN domain nuclease of toxin-antitoxin system
MKLLLDTSTFLWVIAGVDDRLPKLARSAIQDPDHEVWFSVVSVWEIGVKQKIGRLELPGPAWSYATAARERHGIESLPLTEPAVAHLTKLPDVHNDPFDRMLVCQAIEHDLLIVTSDPLVCQYPVKTLWQ